MLSTSPGFGGRSVLRGCNYTEYPEREEHQPSPGVSLARGLLLDLRRPGFGVGGYGAYKSDGDAGTRWWADPGMLDGAAGVGLALLAATQPVEPEWDRALAISMPAAGDRDG